MKGDVPDHPHTDQLSSSQALKPKMSSTTMKTLIVNAILKIAGENPALNHEGAPSAEEARNNFIRLLIAELFPECPSVDLPEPEVDQLTASLSELTISIPTEQTKKRGPMSEEAKAAMKAKREATKAAKSAAPAAPASPTPAPAPPAPAAPKKPKKKASTEPVEPVPAPALAPELPASPKKKAAPKKKAVAPAGEVNLAKIDPTWRKHLKAADKDRAKELEPELLTYLNGLSKDDFNAKKAEEHVQDFVTTWRTAAVEKQEAELTEVEFNGKEYLVNPETKRVYEITSVDADGMPSVNPIGYVGMAAFKEMILTE